MHSLIQIVQHQDRENMSLDLEPTQDGQVIYLILEQLGKSGGGEAVSGSLQLGNWQGQAS